MRVLRGELWAVSLDPTIANERRGTRPCLVISVDPVNALPIRQAIVVPLTSRERGFPHHVPVRDDGRLTRPSWAMCEGVRAVSTRRFGSRIGAVRPETLDEVTTQIVRWLQP